jgi:hypothetical protein
MIQELDGTASEPTRRRHVVTLSAATAAVSLFLLFLLIAPTTRFGATPQADSPAPSKRGYEMKVVGGPPLHHLRLDLTRDSMCPDGTRLIPPYDLMRSADTGEVFAVRYVVGGANRSVPVQLVLDKQSSYWIVACGTFETAPWTDR